MALTVLNLIQQNFSSIRGNYQASTELQLLQQQMSIDFNRFHTIQIEGDLGELKLKHPLDSISYQIDNGVLMRKRDTIYKDLNEVEYFYKGRKAQEGQVDAIKLFTQNNEIFVFIYKINAAQNSFLK